MDELERTRLAVEAWMPAYRREVFSNQLMIRVGVMLALVPIAWFIARFVVDDRNKNILRDAARTILYEAKHNLPEHGVYVLDDVCADYWGNPVGARLRVNEHSNSVILHSGGRNGAEDGGDVYYKNTDVHVREVLKAGVQETGRSWGKGLAQGVMEGIREESAKELEATKAKASELLSRFRKVDG